MRNLTDMSIIDGESGTIESTLFLGNIMGLEKFDDEIAEYLETKRKHIREALKLADLSDNKIEQYCANIEKEILGFVKCNEAYA